MKQKVLLTAVAAGILVLAGCGSTTAGTAAIATGVGPTVSGGGGLGSSPSVPGGPTDGGVLPSAPIVASTPVPETSSVAETTSSTVPPVAPTTDNTSSSSETGSPGSAVDPGPPISTSSSSSTSITPTKTIGQGTDSIDAGTIKWFDTLCTGVAGLADLGPSLVSGGDPGSSPDALKKIGNSFKAAAGDLDSTTDKLKTLPAPTFDGGAEYAVKAVGALGQFSALLRSAADKLAAGDTAALTSLGTAAESGPIADLEGLKASPALEKAVAAIPSCAKAGFTVT